MMGRAVKDRTNRLLFAGFFATTGLALVIMTAAAISIGDTFLAVWNTIAILVCAFIVADALRYHGKHEQEFL
jgi:predicted membrane metal-binding protein